MTNLCPEPGCDRKAEVKGKCQKHYQRDYDARKRAARLGTIQPVNSQAAILREQFASTNYNMHHFTPDNPRWEAKIRIQLHKRLTGCTNTSIGAMVDRRARSVSEWLKSGAWYPTESVAAKILTLIDENGQLIPQQLS